MPTVRDIYEDAIRFEQKSLAHYIFHLLQEGKFSLQDDAETLDFSKADHEKVRELIKANVLGIRPIRVFALKQKPNRFVFIFATDEQQARTHFIAELKSKPLNCHEYPLDFVMTIGNRAVSFRELRKEFSCPAIIGFYEREPLYQNIRNKQ